MWGEHMHHGYYEVGKPVKNHQEAQVIAETQLTAYQRFRGSRHLPCTLIYRDTLALFPFAVVTSSTRFSPQPGRAALAIVSRSDDGDSHRITRWT
jgi:hypothetical protein